MQRAERIVYIGLAGVFGKVAEAIDPSRAWSVAFLAVSVTILAVSANVTALQRALLILRHLRGRDGRTASRLSEAPLKRAGH